MSYKDSFAFQLAMQKLAREENARMLAERQAAEGNAPPPPPPADKADTAKVTDVKAVK